jgi:hypothetical protein
MFRFFIFRISAGIADVRVSQGDDLAGIGGVCQNFLITGHGGIEYHLTDRFSGGSNAGSPKQTAVS